MAKKEEVAVPALAMPDVPATQADIERWYIVQEQLTSIKEEEMKLRKKIFGTYFPHPTEGVNDCPMSEGFVMKGTYKIDRKVVEEALQACQEEFKAAKLPLKELVVMKPSLSVSAYKKLTEEQQHLFDKALEIKPGAPTLAIVKPKRA